MDVIDPNFQIYINSDLDFADFGRWLHRQWADLRIKWMDISISGETFDNWIQVKENPDRNLGLLGSEEDWLHYHYFVIVAYKHKSITKPSDVEKQINFARSMRQKLVEANCIVKVDAEFENSL